MNDSPTKRPEGPRTTVYSYDCRSQLGSAIPWDGAAPTAEELAARVLRDNPTFAFEHDDAKGVFRLTWADGRVEVFRDQPVRHLVLEADAQTGELKPVVRRGSPWFLHLSREEREVR